MNSVLTQKLAPLAVEPAFDAHSPVFIVGPGRSGTTLLTRILNKHHDLAIFPETWMYVILDQLGCLEAFSDRWQYSLFMNRVWKVVVQNDALAANAVALEAAARPSYTGPVKDVLRKVGERYSRLRGTRLWGEKTPGHVLWLSDIRRTFPGAKLLMMIRDPRDVIVSYCERWNRGRFDAAYVLRTAAQLRHHLHHCLRPPFPQNQVRWVRYETLASQPGEVVREICSFLDLPFDPQMLEFYRDYNETENASADGNHHRLLAEPVTAKHVGRFRRVFSPSLLRLVEEFLGDDLLKVGYQPEANSRFTATDEEAIARQQAVRVYSDMASGKVRRRLRRGSQLKLWACRILGSAVKAYPRLKFALTAEDWQARVSLRPVESVDQPQAAKKPSESLGLPPASSRNQTPLRN